jgi:hypothetical protein
MLFHTVAVDDSKPAETLPGEIVRQMRTQSAGPAKRHLGFRQPRHLAGAAILLFVQIFP